MDATHEMHSLDFGGGRVGWEPLPCLYVAPLDPDHWRVSVTPGGYGTDHPDRDSALAAARRACRRQWEHTGEPCLVRLQDTDGTRQVLEGFGQGW